MSGIHVERFDRVPVARPRGDIDAANAAAIREELSACLRPDTDDLVLDLSGTRYLDSAALDMLFRLGERLQQRRARLLLVIPADSQLRRLGEIVGLPQAMPVLDTVPQALADCAEHAASATVSEGEAELETGGQEPVLNGDESNGG
jgi:anti-anti-sigma factor